MTERMTAAQARAVLGRKGKRNTKKHKFGAVRTTVDGRTFDSKREAARYRELRQLEQAGVIRDLECQPQFDIVIDGRPLLLRSKGYPNGRKARYRADFAYTDADGGRVIEDVKSKITAGQDGYRLRKALVEHLFGVRIVEIH